MSYLQIFRTGLAAGYVLLIGFWLYSITLPAETVNTLPRAGHGLRVFIDPHSGEFVRPEELPDQSAAQFNLQAGLPPDNRPIPLSERRSTVVGGGYLLNTGQLFRADRGAGS